MTGRRLLNQESPLLKGEKETFMIWVLVLLMYTADGHLIGDFAIPIGTLQECRQKIHDMAMNEGIKPFVTMNCMESNVKLASN
jgi:hypothetical protein